MLHNDYPGQNCSIARALEAVGERWTLLIVRDLLAGPRRFGELEQRLGIAKNVLTARLNKLLERGIAEKTPAADPSAGDRYRLTSRGEDLFPVLQALMAWGDTHDAPLGPPITYRHSCGHAAGHRVICEACGEPVGAGNVTAVPAAGR